MNIKKTKWLNTSNTSNNSQILKIEDKIIERVSEYPYLGQTITDDYKLDKELVKRIGAGWGAFNKYKEIMTNRETAMSIKRKIFNQIILPAMTYGSETWTCSKYDLNRLKVAQRAIERASLNISLIDKVRNDNIRKKTKFNDIIIAIKKSKWRWAGHIARTDDKRWTKIVTNWTPTEGKRKKGRPKTRWVDEIKNMSTCWMEIARKRDEWKSLGEAYIQKWIETG